MSYEDDPLWRALHQLVLDDPASPFPFTRRLARDQGWSLGYAMRVVHEYRRFLYLSQVAGHVVTPSDEVDQAWHLHLVYTRSYWHDLCESTLGQPLHHGPTRGGTDEQTKYRDLYARTVKSYARIFGEPPPRDIWPATEERFAGQVVRIDRRDHWIVRKPWRHRK